MVKGAGLRLNGAVNIRRFDRRQQRRQLTIKRAGIMIKGEQFPFIPVLQLGSAADKTAGAPRLIERGDHIPVGVQIADGELV